MRKFYQWIVLSVVLLTAATICFLILNSIRANEIQKEVHSWVGYRFHFPAEVQLISGDGSSLLKPYKILIYTDNMGCTSCSLKLQEWSHIHETVYNKIVPDELTIIILFDGSDKEHIQMLTRNARWEMPVLWDSNGVMNRHRKFPKKDGMRCMLLDKENKVMAVGNPVYSKAVHDLYLKLLINKIEAIKTIY